MLVLAQLRLDILMKQKKEDKKTEMKKNILLIFMISFCFSFSQNDSIIVSHQSGFYDSFFLKAHSNFGELVYEINGDEARINSKKW